MKGLLLKDFYLMYKQFKVYFLLCFFLIVVSFWSKSMLLLMLYPCMLAGMLPYTLWNLDETCKWDSYQKTLPVPFSTGVSEKYLIGLISQMLIFAFLCVTQGLKFAYYGADSVSGVGAMLLCTFGGTLLTSAVTMPFVVYFGAQKGRFASAIAIGTLYAGGFALQTTVDFSVPHNTGVGTFFLVSVLLYAASWWISVLLYCKKCRKSA